MPWFLLVLLLWCLPVQAAPLREQDIVDFLGGEVAQRYQVPRSQVEIEWMGARLTNLLRAKLPETGVSMAIEGKPRLIGRVAVPLSLSVGGRRLQTVYPQVSIQVWQQVYVASQILRRGTLLEKSMARSDQRSLETVLGSPLDDLAGFEGALAKRDVPEGAILLREMFELPVLAHAGSMVQVRLKSGGLTVLTQGRVVNNGARGQLVTVANPDSRKNYVGRVVGPDLVEVRMEDTP